MKNQILLILGLSLIFSTSVFAVVCDNSNAIQEFLPSEVEAVADEIDPIQNELVMAAKACDYELMKSKIASGANINGISYDDAGSQTYPIFKAVKNCNKEFNLKIIEDFNIDLSLKRPINETPVLLPTIRYNPELAIALIEKKLININAVNANNKSNLHVAINWNRPKVIEALFASTDPVYNINTHKTLNKYNNPLRLASTDENLLEQVLNHPEYITPFKEVYIDKTLIRMTESFDAKIQEARDAGNEEEAQRLTSKKKEQINKVLLYRIKHHS